MANWYRAALVPTVRPRRGFTIMGRRAWSWRALSTSRFTLAIPKFSIRRRDAFGQARSHFGMGYSFRTLEARRDRRTLRMHGTEYAIKWRKSANFRRLGCPIPISRKISPTLLINVRSRVPGHLWGRVPSTRGAQVLCPGKTPQPHIEPEPYIEAGAT